MTPNIAVAVSRCTPVDVTGTFQRHSSPRLNTLSGSAAGGRWGFPRSHSVLYLGRPTSSVIIEAYRHLVDDTDGMTGDYVGPRRLWTVEVAVTSVLDLRDADAREEVSLSLEDLRSPTDQYEKCQRVAQAAYQLQMHGVIAPAAEGGGVTLALFEEHLPVEELPNVVRRETWEHLPADPRRLRALPDLSRLERPS